MGCGASKGEQPVGNCSQRKSYIKSALAARSSLAAAHATYIHAISDTAAAFKLFSRGEFGGGATADSSAAAADLNAVDHSSPASSASSPATSPSTPRWTVRRLWNTPTQPVTVVVPPPPPPPAESEFYRPPPPPPPPPVSLHQQQQQRRRSDLEEPPSPPPASGGVFDYFDIFHLTIPPLRFDSEEVPPALEDEDGAASPDLEPLQLKKKRASSADAAADAADAAVAATAPEVSESDDEPKLSSNVGADREDAEAAAVDLPLQQHHEVQLEDRHEVEEQEIVHEEVLPIHAKQIAEEHHLQRHLQQAEPVNKLEQPGLPLPELLTSKQKHEVAADSEESEEPPVPLSSMPQELPDDEARSIKPEKQLEDRREVYQEHTSRSKDSPEGFRESQPSLQVPLPKVGKLEHHAVSVEHLEDPDEAAAEIIEETSSNNKQLEPVQRAEVRFEEDKLRLKPASFAWRKNFRQPEPEPQLEPQPGREARTEEAERISPEPETVGFRWWRKMGWQSGAAPDVMKPAQVEIEEQELRPKEQQQQQQQQHKVELSSPPSTLFNHNDVVAAAVAAAAAARRPAEEKAAAVAEESDSEESESEVTESDIASDSSSVAASGTASGTAAGDAVDAAGTAAAAAASAASAAAKEVVRETDEDDKAANEDADGDADDDVLGLDDALSSPMQLVDVLREQFLKASEAGRPLLRMLEARRTQNSAERGFSDHSARLLSALSRTRTMSLSRDEQLNGAASDEECGVSGSHTNTLQRLYAWEKKLFDEVKAWESLNAEFDKKQKVLRNQDAKGAKTEAIDKTRASMKALETQIAVALQAIEASSATIQRISDEEVLPQLLELLQGLGAMWKGMHESHTHKYNVVQLARFFQYPKLEPTSSAHRRATLQLEAAFVAWHTHLSSFTCAQRDYLRLLKRWTLIASVPATKQDHHQSSQRFRGQRRDKPACPKIKFLCERWSKALEREDGSNSNSNSGLNSNPHGRREPEDPTAAKVALATSDMVEAIKAFAETLRDIGKQQVEEIRIQKRAEVLAKDLTKRVAYMNSGAEKRGAESREKQESAIRALRAKVDEEQDRFTKAIQETRLLTLSSLQDGLPRLFKRLSESAGECMRAYEQLYTSTQDYNPAT